MDESQPQLPTVVNCLAEALAGETTLVPLATEVSPELAAYLREWLREALQQTQLRQDIAYMNRLPPGFVHTPASHLTSWTGEQLLEMTHLVLAMTAMHKETGQTYSGNLKAQVADLRRLLGYWNFHLVPADNGLVYRVDPAIALAANIAMQTAEQAGRPNAVSHLRESWLLAYSMHPEPGRSVHAAYAAVETAMLPVVIPNDGRGMYSRAVSQLRANQSLWRLVIITDKGDDSIEPLIQMLDRLGMAEVDRHEGSQPKDATTLESARACAHLAATLVQWFSSGAVQRR